MAPLSFRKGRVMADEERTEEVAEGRVPGGRTVYARNANDTVGTTDANDNDIRRKANVAPEVAAETADDGKDNEDAEAGD